MDIPTYDGEIPYLTTEQMVEVDRAMMEDFKIDLIQMMENAGRNLAHLARIRFLNGDPRAKRVVVLAGTGGNGGGALVCARHLYNYGARVEVLVTREPSGFTGVPAHQLEILHYMKVPISQANSPQDVAAPDLIIDGIIGYSLRGCPRGTASELIRWANEQAAPTLSLDVPSGVDTTSGIVFNPAIRATATMTLALPKYGFRAPGTDVYVGELYLADIGVPPALYARPPLALEVDNLFAESDIIRLS